MKLARRMSSLQVTTAGCQALFRAIGTGINSIVGREPTGGWHAHVLRNKVEIAVSVDKGGRITAQSASKQLAARCSQLYEVASRYVSGGAGAEGSLAASMGVIDAGLDCQEVRYEEGIQALEKVLNGQRISYSPD